MLKVLRKHNKWILVIGGSLLMIAWLMPQSLQRLGPGSKGPVEGTLDGRDVRTVELQRSNAELRVVEALAPHWVRQFFGSGRSAEPAHWLLLTHEAEEAGFVGGPQDGLDWLHGQAMPLAFAEVRQRFAQLDDATFQRFARQVPALQQQVQERASELAVTLTTTGLEQAAGNARMSLQEAQTALAKARGIERMANAYILAARTSERAARVSAQSWGDQATVDTVFIPADLAPGGTPEPTEEELQAHFQKYREAIPGTGEFGIGYMLPPRIKLEWMMLDRSAIVAAAPVDPVAAYKRWQQNRTTFAGEFADEKSAVEAAIRNDRADEIIQAATLVVKAEVFKAVKDLAADGPYKKLGPDWDQARPRLADIAVTVQAQVRESTGVQIPLPEVVIRDAEWMDAEDLMAEEGFGESQIRYLSDQAPLVRPARAGALPIIFQIRELGFENPLRMQTGIPVIDFPAEDPLRNVYFYTILDARKQSAPDSLDEVRGAALADLKKIRAYEGLAARAEEFRQMAIAGGLSAIVDSFRPAELTLDIGEEGPQLPTLTPGILVSRLQVGPAGRMVDTEAFRAAVMSAAEAIDPLLDPGAYDPAVATVAVAIPEQLGLAVTRIKALTPLTWESYRQNIEPVLERQAQQEVLLPETWPFTFEAAAARHGWAIRAREDEEAPGEPAPTDPAPTEQG